MAYRNIFIANTSKLSVKNEQLIVDNGETFSFPIEDIRCVLLEDSRTVLTSALISKFARAGVTMIICDEKHMPTAALSPINGYSRRLSQIKLQISATAPLKKRMWQKTVSAKIRNQAKCLGFCGKDGADKLLSLAGTVNSGDTSNVEGRAASFYFKALFDEYFRRGADDPINSALDYGYAVLRAYISRTVCLYGFEPSLGIHHCSELNSFNLCDDMIEPFRPVIDMIVSKTIYGCVEFDTAAKAQLLKALNAVIFIKGKYYSVADAVEITVRSFADCLKSGRAEPYLPALCELEFKMYE